MAGPDATTYAKRRNRFDEQDIGWWIEDEFLVSSDGKGVERRTRWSDVLEVQTSPAPARFRPWRHQTMLGLRNSSRIVIDNAHYVGTANFEDRSVDYAPFIGEVIDKVAEKAPYAKARSGASYLGYVTMLVFVVVLLVLLGGLIFLLPIEGVPGVVFIKAALLLLAAPPLFAWVIKSRPSGIRLEDLPAGALPRVQR